MHRSGREATGFQILSTIFGRGGSRHLATRAWLVALVLDGRTAMVGGTKDAVLGRR
jgi:hypothetical protein